MRHLVACTVLVCLPTTAGAAPIGSLDLGSTFVSGPVTPGAWNPALRFGLGATVGAQTDRADWRVAWGVWRDQVGCDTCDAGAGPGQVGRELLGSTDLAGSVGRRIPLGSATVRLAADLVLPASRDALVCNPFYGAPAASAQLTAPVAAASLRLSARAARPIYRYDAVPVGLCAPALDGGPIGITSGPTTPTAWGGVRPGAANPTAAGGLAVAASDLHALLVDPGRITTGVSLGVDATRSASAEAVSVPTASGTVRLDDGRSPFTVALPWSVSAGVAASDRLDLSLAASHRVPALLTDPGGTLRAVPGRVALTLTVSGHL